ncbi:hypothetical protein W01_16320 [Candidatus Nitrotoga sp. AM1P]|nr:hypothetical protein W01_16320 [Candidatus Nitrotoga sp. AM1P]
MWQNISLFVLTEPEYSHFRSITQCLTGEPAFSTFNAPEKGAFIFPNTWLERLGVIHNLSALLN